MTIDKNSSLALGITETTAATTTKNDSKKYRVHKKKSNYMNESLFCIHIFCRAAEQKKKITTPEKGDRENEQDIHI